jgi:threonine/homoserine/homoserine lactone efflux protein
LQAGAQIVLSTVQLVLAGIGIGVLMAAPIGPVNVLVIQRTVARGFWGGLAAGLGAVVGDGLLAAIAAFSVTAISDAMYSNAGWIKLVGGVLLVAFGVALLFTRPALTIPVGQKSHLLEHTGIIPQTFFLTVTNPGAILGMAAMIGGSARSLRPTPILRRCSSCSPMGGSLWWLTCLS